MKNVLNHPLIAVKLISALFFLLLLMPQTAKAQETPPFNPCVAVSSTSVCMDNSHSCDETQAACSTGYCWSAGAPSVNAGIPVGGLVENKVIEIGGTYVVTISATFKNCTFRMSGDSRIRIAPNGNDPINISFENCDIFGCDEMWQGIVVDATNAANNFTFRFLDGTIEDAYIGLRLDELKGNYSIADNSFRNNHIGISNVRQNGGDLNASIIRNHFFQSAELAERTGTLDDPFSMPDYPLAHAVVKYVNVVSAIGALETVQTGNTTNIFECLQYGIVTEQGRVQSMSNLFQIIGRFGIFSTDGGMRVIGCEFLISGITGIHAVGSELKVQKNTFNGVWREGVHSEQNLNSERITINEDNQFTISAAVWTNGIYVERPQATDGKHCVIDGNTFTVTSNPSFVLYCIHLEDFVNAKDEMEVSNNTITINSFIGGVFAIQACMGSSDQLNVHDNTIHYGTIADMWASFGIRLFASGGQNLSNGNIIRDNIVTGINVDRDENAVQCAFHISAISGTEFCDNVVDQSFRGMHFVNSNDVELRTTQFNNHTLGLHIDGTNGRIGQQIGRGNEWDLDTDACVDFATQVSGGQPINSRIIVTQGNSLPWLPDNDKISPDPTLIGNPNWFFDASDDDDDTCLSPLEHV